MKNHFRVQILFMLSVRVTSMVFSQSDDQTQRLSIQQLDAESQQCMMCHNGSLGTKVELRAVDAPLEIENAGLVRTTNHAIGMSYQASYEKNTHEYVAPAALNPAIRLDNGIVGCLSCHVKREIQVAQIGSSSISSPARCTVDLDAESKAFKGNLCMQCHIK